MPSEQGMEKTRSVTKESLEKHGGNVRARNKAQRSAMKHNRGVYARNKARKAERASAKLRGPASGVGLVRRVG